MRTAEFGQHWTLPAISFNLYIVTEHGRPKMNINRPAWFDEIGCEGGPVIVANLDDFLQWRGSEPFNPSNATELHYWSPFTAELPQQWQPNGPSGHQYLPCANPVQTRESLMAFLTERWPGTSKLVRLVVNG